MIKKFFVVALVSTTLFACSNQAAQTEEKTAATAESVEAPKEVTDALVKAYFELKDALVASDMAGAKAAAEKLAAATQDSAMQVEVNAVVNAADLADQRVAFEAVTASVVAYAKSTNVGAEVYVQYCPMAFDGKGAQWLAAEKEVNNPYYGDMMLHCGMVQETIN